MDHVVTAFLRHRGDVLLVRRSDEVGTYRGLWGGVSGYVETDPADALADARRELAEEANVLDATLVRAGDPLEIDDDGREWTVHPFLFDVDDREVTPNEEIDAIEWAPPTVARDRETVPGLWTAYRRVAPTVETVREDETHGSAWLSARALEVLRDRAAVADDWAEVAAVARELRAARPSMVVVANRIDRTMSEADRTPAAVHDRAVDVLEAALDADEAAATAAADRLDDGPVVTLSRSGTVLTAVRAAGVDLVVGESRPGREGVGVAEALATAGPGVTLTTDAALPAAVAGETALGFERTEAVLVGVDAVLPDGSVVNKVGTRALALAAAREDVPIYAVAARDKVRPDDALPTEAGDDADLYEGDAPLEVANPIFERVPADLVTVVTETGILDADGVAAVADDHRANAAWDVGTGRERADETDET